MEAEGHPPSLGRCVAEGVPTLSPPRSGFRGQESGPRSALGPAPFHGVLGVWMGCEQEVVGVRVGTGAPAQRCSPRGSGRWSSGCPTTGGSAAPPRNPEQARERPGARGPCLGAPGRCGQAQLRGWGSTEGHCGQGPGCGARTSRAPAGGGVQAGCRRGAGHTQRCCSMGPERHPSRPGIHQVTRKPPP